MQSDCYSFGTKSKSNTFITTITVICFKGILSDTHKVVMADLTGHRNLSFITDYATAQYVSVDHKKLKQAALS